MWWGYSQPLDLRQEIKEKEDEDLNVPLEVIIVGSGDARHIVKTLASAYKHRKRCINFHVIEPFLEQVARSILFLSTTLEAGLGIQEATRYYLELMGNTLLRPATAKYLVQRAQILGAIPTQSIRCPWINLEKLKYKDRDILESIFKFWARATCEGIPIVEYWDRRVRKALELRYDYRDGVFDWDYHMVLKSRENTNLTLHEYRFWRRNGIAFTWIEGEPARCNPTLINNIMNYGKGFLHHAYMGDINVGPYFTWSLEMDEKTEKFRATDIAEREIMRAIHEIRTNEPMYNNVAAAHRDPSLLNAIIVTEMPDNEIEQETWSADETFKRCKEDINWTHIPGFQVRDLPGSSQRKYGQLYTIDNEIATRVRMQHPGNNDCSPELLSELDDILRRINPYAEAFKMLYEMEEGERKLSNTSSHPVREVRMWLKRGDNMDKNRFNLPTCNEVAVVFVAEDGDLPVQRDVCVYSKSEGAISIPSLSKHVQPMTLPLMFPSGETGWMPRMKQTEGKREVTALQYYSYKLSDRGEFNPCLNMERLSQQIKYLYYNKKFIDIYV